MEQLEIQEEINLMRIKLDKLRENNLKGKLKSSKF
jgi:hypothetical protein